MPATINELVNFEGLEDLEAIIPAPVAGRPSHSKTLEIAVPLKHLNNFWRSLEMRLRLHSLFR